MDDLQPEELALHQVAASRVEPSQVLLLYPFYKVHLFKEIQLLTLMMQKYR